MEKSGGPRALVSFSGGLDSTVCLYWAIQNYSNVYALFFDYGQKALESEQRTVREICKEKDIELFEVSLGFLGEFSKSSLNKDHENLPESIDLESKEETKRSAQSVWVPNRNGLFINAAASLLESKGGGDLILGFNKEEAETFPDNSSDFLDQAERALYYSTKNQVKLVSPTLKMTKDEIYSLGLDLGVDMEKVWPCYKSGDKPCGVCESCMRFYRAKKRAEEKLAEKV